MRSFMVALSGACALLLMVAVNAAAAPRGIPRMPGGKPDFSGIWETTSAADYGLEPHGNRDDAPASAGIIEGTVIPLSPGGPGAAEPQFRDPRGDRSGAQGLDIGGHRAAFTSANPSRSSSVGTSSKSSSSSGNRSVQSIRMVRSTPTMRTAGCSGTRAAGGKATPWSWTSRTSPTRTWLDGAGDFHSPDLHVVERWKFLDPDTIAYRRRSRIPRSSAAPGA